MDEIERREIKLILQMAENEMHKIIYDLHEEQWVENECQRLLEILILRNKCKKILETP